MSLLNLAAFLLQTPRDGKAFCSLSLVNCERSHCGGVFIADEKYSLNALLGSQPYLNTHPKVPRDFAILPLQVLVHHVEETVEDVKKLHRELIQVEKNIATIDTERRFANGDISLDDNEDFKRLNRFNQEHLRLQRRSKFELELTENLLKYIDKYSTMWRVLWEGDTSYVDEFKEKTQQQFRYAEQSRTDLDVIPRRVKIQSKTVCIVVVLIVKQAL